MEYGTQVKIISKVRNGSIGTYAGAEKTAIGILHRIEFEDGTGAGLYGINDFVAY